jgi:hypothetical protein
MFKIGETGVKALADSTGMLTNLKRLFLNDNLIRDEGLKALAGATYKLKNL